MKNLIQKVIRERWIQHFVLFLILGFFIVRIFKPFEWPKLDVVILSTAFGAIGALAFEVFQSDVSGSNRFDIKPLKWLHKLKIISLTNTTSVSYADVLVSTIGFSLGSFLTQII